MPPRGHSAWASPTLVGRDAEIARLSALVDAGGALALVGEAGIGKTRLAREASSLARARGRDVVAGGAGSLDAERPLAPLRDAVRSRSRAEPAPRLSDPLAAAFPAMVLPELHEDLAGREPAQEVVFEAAARWCSGLAAEGGLLLVLEDLHWADAATHRLVLYLARVAAGGPVGLIVTFRPDEAEPGSSLDELRRELTRERLADELRLDPLDRAAVARLVAGLVGAEPEPPVVDRFLEAGGGNPFVTEEFLGAAVAAGRIVPGQGGWHGSTALGLPWGVAEMVLSRVRRMAPGDREFLRLAAVGGERFPFDLVAAAWGRGEDEALASLARAGAAGLVRDDADDAPAFRHALAYEAVLGSMSGAERRAGHRRLLAAGEALAAAGADVPVELLLAQAIGAGDRAAAFRYARAAAERSLGLGAEPAAILQAERALELWSPDDGAEARAALLLQHGRLLHRVAHEHARAAEALAAAARGYADLGDATTAGLAAALAASSRWWAGDPEALSRVSAAARNLPADAPLELRLEAMDELARPLMLSGLAREASRIAADGLALVPPGAGRSARLQRVSLLTTLGTCRFILADFAAGEELLADSALAALDLRDPVGACRAYHNVAFGVDELARMAGYAEAGLAVAREAFLRPYERAFLIALAVCATERGDFARAEALCDEAELVAGPWLGIAHTRLDVGLPRALLALARGEADDARAELTAVLERLRSAHELGEWAAGRGLALALLAAGEPAAARDALAPQLQGTDPRGYGRILALPIAVELAAGAGSADEARRAADELARIAPDGPRTPFARALAEAAGGRPGAAAAIEAAAGARESAGRRVEAARWRLAGATTLAGDDDDGAAALARRALDDFRAMGAEGWSRRAEQVLRRLGVRVPSRPSGAGPGGLTARELEVLGLVADGLSNREIGERLFISQKTAGRHVSNLFAKLGAHTRAQAARLALERGLLDARPAPEGKMGRSPDGDGGAPS
jgi:DNA-binding CsgD family transcriptional regulator